MLPPSPDQLFGDLFRDVQLGGIFPDSKTFVDCVPKLLPADLMALYETAKTKPGFDLGQFVRDQFVLPGMAAGEASTAEYVSDRSLSTIDHINQLWNRLSRPADTPVEGGSRVPLPHPYVVPGGRFREIFYWDSYFTMLGLRESGRADLIRNMIDNFAYLIDRFGFIPNGNRTYFLTRSQPPFFALMVQLLAEIDGPGTLLKYLPQLQSEYDFWMSGQDDLTPDRPVSERVVRLADGGVLNRYWDETLTPRPEAYRVEYNLAVEAQKAGIDPAAMHRHLRTACESGWDFSSRWFGNRNTMVSTRTGDIIPVDLNCLLYFLETTLQQAYSLSNSPQKAQLFNQLALTRRQRIDAYFWNEASGFYHDHDSLTQEQTPALTLAAAFPLFFNLATPQQAGRVHDRLKDSFLKAGGWVTTLEPSGQQWDWPNGWAPLQWIVYRGLLNYDFVETARESRDCWLALNDKVFKATGKMMEKYNVADASLTTGGGKYPNQDGFGWTNGVYVALTHDKATKG